MNRKNKAMKMKMKMKKENQRLTAILIRKMSYLKEKILE
jgi:hypothetical protein